MTDIALELQNLTHRYGKQIALDDLNLKLESGRIYGLLGRNGAGKTTLLNILSAGIFQTSGKALIFGHSAMEHVPTLKKLCLIREKSMYPQTARIREILAACSGLYPNWDEEYAQKLLNVFELNPKKRYKQLSRGMESSLGLVIGLASRAELTVFDEPSLGLDAVARENFYDQLIHDIESHPRTVIVSTHLIDEVARLFEEVVIIDKGKILRHEPIGKLLASAVTVTGSEEAVERATSGKTVLHRDKLGGMAIASVMRAENDVFEDVEIEPLPLQKLFVYLTEGSDAK